MKPRFLILLAIAIGLAVYFAMGKNKNPAVTQSSEEEPTYLPGGNESAEETREISVPLSQRPLPGEAPNEEPDFDVRVEVDPSGKKNRLYLFISEKHGFYVESPVLRIWYKRPGVTGAKDSPLTFQVVKSLLYIKANETLKTCIEVVPAELRRVNNDIGTSENWEARVESHGRVRATNPATLPKVPAEPCD